MRIAVVADIHGNLTALEAVLADLRLTAPDAVVHGGDLAHSGARPAEVVDRVRQMGWQGVLGNTDEMLYDRGPLRAFAGSEVSFPLAVVEEMAEWTAGQLGPERLEWMRALPRRLDVGSMALVHATPGDIWRAPQVEAGDADLAEAYALLHRPLVVYCHIHRPFVRRLGEMTVANTGSVGMSFDGDRRASYLLVTDGTAETRRVDYDVDAEIAAVKTSGLPHADWVGRILEAGAQQKP